MALSDSKIQRAYRLRIAVFMVCAVLLVIVLDLGDQTVQTLRIVSTNEHERDSWQQPAMVIAMLNLRVGSKVADIGCGAGYFALKLASVVGSSGRVLAEDILRTPLVFLWIRALLHDEFNLYVLLGEPDDRGPVPVAQEPPDTEAEHHEIAPTVVDTELRDSGFEVVSQQDHFIDPGTEERPGDRPGEHTWWLIVARKP